MVADGAVAGVAVVPANLLRRAIAAADAAFLDSVEDSIVVMKSLEESIRDMEKERQQVIKTKAKLSQKLRIARQRLVRLKKKDRSSTRRGELLHELSTVRSWNASVSPASPPPLSWR